MTNAVGGFADLEGASFYYELIGKGRTLVLLHGFSFDSTLWDSQIESFASSFQVLRYDLRGFGRSTSTEVAYSHAEDLKAVLDFLNLDRVTLLGFSLGGGAAINFTLLYPRMVQALILVAPSLGGFRWSEQFASAQNSLQTIARKKGVEIASKLWLRQTIFRQAMNKKDVAEKLRKMVTGYSGWHWVHSNLGKPLTPPARERLHEIQIPTLLFVGDSDAPDQLKIVETLEAEIGGARKIVYPGVGHAITLEVPDRFNADVLNFLDEIAK